MRRNNINAMQIVVVTTFALILPACGNGTVANWNGTIANGNGKCSTVTYNAPSGTANNIVFTFDKLYVCGQFANGDWWVSPDSAGGTVRVVSITPDGIVGKHGVQINPTSTTAQAFDKLATIESRPPYNGSLLAAIPGNVPGGSSIVKAVSILPEPALGSRPKLQFAAVLSVLDTPLANSDQYFRPAYFGNTKTFYNTSAIQLANLPKYNATTLPGVAGFTITSVATRYRHVQLDHYNNWTGGDMHPKDNMPEYGAQIATDNGVYLLRLLLADFNYANTVHKQALVNYLQMAIDFQAMAAGGNIWPANGGHASGRKLPLVFAAKLFNDPAFSSAIAASAFAEDQQVWRSPVTGLALFGDTGVTTDAGYWQTTRTGSGSSTIRDPYGYIDGGGYELGNSYQFCCISKPWKYTVLALYMLGLQSAWSSDPVLIDYVERWMFSGSKALPDPCAPYDGVFANYGVTYGPSSPGQCIADTNSTNGIGRWPLLDNKNIGGGLYGNAFGDQLWTWYKANP